MRRSNFDFPTRVGMARQTMKPKRSAKRFPHPRGDGPHSPSSRAETRQISPPAWGWPVKLARPFVKTYDFPTRVGMARMLYAAVGSSMGFPHPRGDGPRRRKRTGTDLWISPPAWGWPESAEMLVEYHEDFPTRVGMARSSGVETLTNTGISPPAWGWPGNWIPACGGTEDFPTRVGMARRCRLRRIPLPGFPHPRGDGPIKRRPLCSLCPISPPAWGWPVGDEIAGTKPLDFPTRVGMARRGGHDGASRHRFPHPRGDGPPCRPMCAQAWPISPPAWGWPGDGFASAGWALDFPTRVGMARNPASPRIGRPRFPHPRGDGPNVIPCKPSLTLISPPAWGWPG